MRFINNQKRIPSYPKKIDDFTYMQLISYLVANSYKKYNQKLVDGLVDMLEEQLMPMFTLTDYSNSHIEDYTDHSIIEMIINSFLPKYKVDIYCDWVSEWEDKEEIVDFKDRYKQFLRKHKIPLKDGGMKEIIEYFEDMTGIVVQAIVIESDYLESIYENEQLAECIRFIGMFITKKKIFGYLAFSSEAEDGSSYDIWNYREELKCLIDYVPFKEKRLIKKNQEIAYAISQMLYSDETVLSSAFRSAFETESQVMF